MTIEEALAKIAEMEAEKTELLNILFCSDPTPHMIAAATRTARQTFEMAVAQEGRGVTVKEFMKEWKQKENQVNETIRRGDIWTEFCIPELELALEFLKNHTGAGMTSMEIQKMIKKELKR